MKALKEAKIQIVAISYDDPKILKTFAKKNDIEFPLLSDPDSKTIDAFEARNKKARGNKDGVPYPGTFLVDAEGVVRSKLFYEGVRKRHHGEDIIKAAKEIAKTSKRATKQ